MIHWKNRLTKILSVESQASPHEGMDCPENRTGLVGREDAHELEEEGRFSQPGGGQVEGLDDEAELLFVSPVQGIVRCEVKMVKWGSTRDI